MQIIAPLINGFAFLAFGLFWFAYKARHSLRDVKLTDSTCSFGSRTSPLRARRACVDLVFARLILQGLFYPSAIGHVFAALYIQLLCMTGLFFLARDVNDAVSALPEAICTSALPN